VFGREDDGVRCVECLATFDALCRGFGQVLSARLATRWLVVDDLVGIEPHRQVLSRGARLFASVAIQFVSLSRLRLSPTVGTGLGRLGLMFGRIGRRRERRVLRALVQPSGEFGHRACQALDLIGEHSVLRPQCFDLLLEMLTILFRHACNSSNVEALSRIARSGTRFIPQVTG
jgi:hypothetical protein